MANNIIQVFSNTFIILFGPYQNLPCVKDVAELNQKFGLHFIAEHFNMGACYCLFVLLFVYFTLFWKSEEKEHKQIKDWKTFKEAVANINQGKFLRFFLKFSLFMIMFALLANSMAYGRGVWHYFFTNMTTSYTPNHAFLAIATFPRAAFNALILINTAIVIATFAKVTWLSFKYGLSYDEPTRIAVLELVPASIVFSSLLGINILFYYHQVAIGIFYKFYLVCH